MINIRTNMSALFERLWWRLSLCGVSNGRVNGAK